MLRVVHVTDDVAGASGIGTFVRRINDELNKLGVESSIVTNIEDLRRRGMEPAPYQLIVHIHGIWLGLHHAAAKWAKAHGAKIVWSTHGMTAPWAMHHKWWKKRLAWMAYQKRDLMRADLVHSTSEQEAKWNEGLGVRRQCIVPLGTDLPEGVVVGSGRGAKDVKTLLFVGRVYPVKALDRLIKAFAMAIDDQRCGVEPAPYHTRCGVESESSRWRLRIVGPDEGGHLAELEKLVAGLSCRCRVEFVGPKYGAELDAEYANCDALALVSHTENFGATVVDAMAHGKPVVTSTNTPWEIVAGDRSGCGRCGWCVENEPKALAKAIEELMAMSDEACAAMGANGRRLVEERYRWPSVGRLMDSFYRAVIQSPR